MADPVPVYIERIKVSDNCVGIAWYNISFSSVCEIAQYSAMADKTVHVYGDFGGDVTIEGSNDPLAISDDPSSASWVTLTDMDGNDLVFSDVGIKVIQEATLYIQIKAGNGVVNTNVIIAANNS